MKLLTEQQQYDLASLAADEIHNSLVAAVQQRHMSEMTSYISVRDGLTKAFQMVLRNVYAED
tara:strand:+ start:536 stop:721 length:186 start_codon:yes stop_codon:yes gene_type:complete